MTGHNKEAVQYNKAAARNRHYKNIIFDLDGTLTDSADGVINSVRYALQKLGIETGESELQSFIGPPLQSSFRDIYGLSEAEVRQAIACFREYYREKGIYENRLYPGVEQMLRQLHENRKKIYLATSKVTQFAETILKYFQVDHYFTFLSGATFDGSRVEKKDVLAHLFEQNSGLDKSNSVMVGDRKHDIIGARSFGLTSIAVTYGYGTKEELRGESPDLYADSVPELTALLLSV